MKRIGLLTYHPWDNYGAVLQAYALQKSMSDVDGNIVETIDFFTDLQRSENDILQLKNIKSFKSILSTLLYKGTIYFSLKKRKSRFNAFRRDFLKLTQNFSTEKQLIDNLPCEDIYVTGSDQVFHPKSRYANVYYLGFSKNGAKKVAYAPSFGLSDIAGNITPEQIKYIKDFDCLSCREQVGADYLSSLLGKRIPCVADPVFLLTKEEWNKVALTPDVVKKYRGRYIFVYRLNGGEPLMNLAKKISNATGLPVVCVAMDCRSTGGAKMIYDAGPRELLGLIKDSAYVVSDAFHGTALSLLYEKEAIIYIGESTTSSRITTLMDRFGLSQNIVHTEEDINNFSFNQLSFIDYSEKMGAFRQLSLDYLKSSLS